jgi:rhamnosyltransferase
MAKIAGVVIVFYPDFKKLLFNIETFINNVEQLFVVFNSPVSSDEVERLNLGYPKVQLIFNNENIGVAATLNQTATKALNLGFEWLLTMDQDSYFQTDFFFIAFESNRNKEDIAIFCPNSDLSSVSIIEDSDVVEEMLDTITSGNLLNLFIWKTLGGFEEKLFIDEVDNDYCLKAVSNGYKILRYRNIRLIHELGRKKEVTFLFKKHTIIIHPPFRAYYIFRNNFYIFNKYKREFPEFVRSRKIILLKSFIKILLFSTERIQNCRYIFLAVKDYRNNAYGPCSFEFK